VIARQIRWPALAAGAIAFVDDAVYAAIIHAQGNSSIVLWAFALIAVAAVAACWGAFARGRRAQPLLALATALLFVLGVLGIFSIGLPLLVGSMFCLTALVGSTSEESDPSRMGRLALIGLGIVALGLVSVYLVNLSTGGSSSSVSSSCVSVPNQRSHPSTVSPRMGHGCPKR
jgi:cytochrome bd-type quinol oxidase subunit 2